jgi:DNA-binding transcriptional ArsR family regulator
MAARSRNASHQNLIETKRPRGYTVMPLQSLPKDTHKMVKTDQTFESAADLFRVMSAPMRLKIINCLCDGEKNVSYLLTQVNTTQPNMSQHLNTLYKAGILGKRREGVQIFYRVVDQRIVAICEAVCVEIANKATTPSA